jgi:hypothetical protein
MPIPTIPMRPKRGVYDLKPEEMDCLNWHILSGCPRDEAFLRFIRPDYLGNRSSPAVKDAVKQFFAMEPVKRYMEEYRNTVTEREEKPKEKPSASMEERKAMAKTKLVEFAMDLADGIENARDPEFVLKMADKAGLLDGEEQVEVAPQRFLAERCSDCRYRVFCEQECEDMCQYCRYRAFGEESGIHYENRDMLDMPNKIGTELASTTE